MLIGYHRIPISPHVFMVEISTYSVGCTSKVGPGVSLGEMMAAWGDISHGEAPPSDFKMFLSAYMFLIPN